MESGLTRKLNIKEMPNAFIDLDGTLLDSMPRHYNVFLDALSYYEIASKITYGDFATHKCNGESTKSICINCGYTDDESNMISDYWKDHIEDIKYLKQDNCYSDTHIFLEEISNYYKVIVLTARRNNYVIEQIKSFSIAKFIDLIHLVDPKYAFDEKKDFIIREGYEHAFCVGDTEHEYKIQQEVEIDTYILNRGFRSKNYWERRNVQSYDSLLSILPLIIR